MAPDTPSDTRPDLTAAYGALAAAAAGVGLVAFAVSYHGLFDLLLRVSVLPWYLAAIGPLGVDFFALVGIAASFVMRHEKWTRRWYAGFVIAAALAMSVAGNWADALSRHLTDVGTASLALSPVIVFLSSHLVVVCRRSMEDRRHATPDRTPEPDAEDLDEEPDSGEEGEATVTAARPFNPQRYARGRRRKGDSCKTIAELLTERGHPVSERTVARWTKDVVPAKPTDSEPAEQPAPEGAPA